MKFPTQEQIEARRSDLLEKIAIGKRAQADLEKLEESLKYVTALVEIMHEEPQDTPERPIWTPNRPKRVFTPLASFAEAAIREYGQLHIDELIKKMNQRRWLSSGDQKLDMKNVFNTLSVNKKFVNLGRNIWDLKEKYPEKS